MAHPPEARESLHTGLLALAAVVLAGVVRLGLLPTWSRLRFDGHERLLLRAFEGSPPDASTQALPLPLALAGLLGRLFDDPVVLVILSGLAGSLAVGCVVLWTARRWGLVAAAWAGLFVALLGEHAAWSTSAYPVMLGHTSLLAAFACEGRGWRTELGAAGLLALACSFRPELALVAPLRGWPGLAGVVGLAHVALLGGVEPSSPWVALQLNWSLVGFLGPSVLMLAVLGLPAALPLLAAAVWVHLTGALFDDYGPRHALFGGVALCVAAAVGAARRRHGALVGLAVALGLGVHLMELRAAWQQRSGPHVPEGTPELSGSVAPTLPEGCVEVTEEPPIAGQPLPSHVRFFTGELEADCVLWGEEDQHRAWSSRSLRPRAQRMRALYRLEPVGVWRPSPHRSARLYHRLERRRGGGS